MKNFFVVSDLFHQSPSREDFSLCSCNQYSITSPESSIKKKNNAYRIRFEHNFSGAGERRYQNIFSRFSYFDHMLLRVLEGFVSLSCIRDMLFEANLEENFSPFIPKGYKHFDIYILGLLLLPPFLNMVRTAFWAFFIHLHKKCL